MPAFKSARAHAGHLVSNYAIILGAKLLPGMVFCMIRTHANTQFHVPAISGQFPKGLPSPLPLAIAFSMGVGQTVRPQKLEMLPTFFCNLGSSQVWPIPLKLCSELALKKKHVDDYIIKGRWVWGWATSDFIYLTQRIRVWFSGWMSNLEEWNPDILGQLVCMQSNSRWFRVIDCHWPFTHLRDHTLQ